MEPITYCWPHYRIEPQSRVIQNHEQKMVLYFRKNHKFCHPIESTFDKEVKSFDSMFLTKREWTHNGQCHRNNDNARDNGPIAYENKLHNIDRVCSIIKDKLHGIYVLLSIASGIVNQIMCYWCNEHGTLYNDDRHLLR